MPHSPSRAPRTVAGRLTAILLTLRSGNSHSLTEMAQLTGLPMSTVHRMAGELASWQLLRRDVDGRYRVGPNVQWLAGSAGTPGLDDRAPLALTDLCEITRRRARLGVLRGRHVAYIEKRPGAAHPPTSWSDGATLPAHATAVGKALLAFGPSGNPSRRSEPMGIHSRTLATPQGLLRQLQIIRLTARRSRGELVPGMRRRGAGLRARRRGDRGSRAAGAGLRGTWRCAGRLTVAARGLSRELSLDAHADGRPHLRALPPADEEPGVQPQRWLGIHRGGDGTVVPEGN